MLLRDKNAVVYGAGGRIGSSVARAFAREGATVFLAGRTLANLDPVVQAIVGAGGKAEAAQVDALDPQAIDQHLATIVKQARHMVSRRSGVILTLSSSASVLSGRDRRYHLAGGFSTACATIEALSRSLAGELGPQGIRVVCLRPDAIPETWSVEPGGDINASGVKPYMEDGTALGRLPTLDEVANTAVFLASDWASAMTGTVANLTCGSIME